MRKWFVWLVSLCFACGLYAIPGHAGEGKQLFLNKCGQCHKSGGTAPTFAATKFAGLQWERFFSREKHQRKKDISHLLTSDEAKKVEQYLKDHSADSEQPEAIGLR